ncbi:MAG: histidine phosphatase family protein [Burkholderiales bacterium]|nr:histidine phosphatase family protein [Burkholderiales bacterium]
MKLWLVRHAQPLIAPGVCYGATDVPADARLTQATAAGLAPLLPAGLTVWTSPLQRCHALAQGLLTLRPDLQLRSDARLAEMDFGCWEGRRWDDIPRSAYDDWTSHFGAARFGGRESVNELLQRVAAARAELQALGQEAVWVTHAGVLRAMGLLEQGHTTLAQAPQWPQDVAGWGEWQVTTLQAPSSSR